MKKLRIEYSPASMVTVLRLPGWPTEPVVEARRDGHDTITLSVLASHPNEEWRFVMLRDGVLSVIPYLTAHADQRPIRTNFSMDLCIPPGLVGQLHIDRSPARKGEPS